MKQNNLIKFLIPVVAVVVVVESVILVSSLDKKVVNSDVSQETEEIAETEINDEPVADFIFETETKEMELGKSYEVNLNLVGKRDVSLDAVEVYVKYDPEKLTVTKLVSNESFPEVTKNSGINSKTGLISSVFLWGLGEVGSIRSDETDSVLSFVVTPKVGGETEISLMTGTPDTESVTMIVESSTSRSLTFSGNNKLEINVTK